MGAPTLQEGGGAGAPTYNFAKNCMKLKEFGPPGGHASLAPPLDTPLYYTYFIDLGLNLYVDLSLFQCECTIMENSSIL